MSTETISSRPFESYLNEHIRYIKGVANSAAKSNAYLEKEELEQELTIKAWDVYRYYGHRPQNEYIKLLKGCFCNKLADLAKKSAYKGLTLSLDNYSKYEEDIRYHGFPRSIKDLNPKSLTYKDVLNIETAVIELTKNGGMKRRTKGNVKKVKNYIEKNIDI